MNSSASVICPGVVFSSLLSEPPAYAEVQEGFLLGSVIQHTCTQISDADISKETTKKTIYVSSYHSLDFLGCLYDSGSRVRQKTVSNVQEMAAKNKQEIVGWYIWRQSSTDSWDRVLLRERLVHQQLRERLCNTNLLFLILNSRKEGPDALPTTNHILNVCNEKVFEHVPLLISNLGNTSNTDYKLDPPNPAIYSAPQLCSILTKLHSPEPGVQEVTRMHAQLEETLKQQLQELSQVQQLHSDKLQRLMALRALCYHNNIVPDFELSSKMGKEKEKLIDTNGEEVSTVESATENQTNSKENSDADVKMEQTNKEKTEANSTGATRRDTTRKRTPVKRLQDSPNAKHEVKRRSPSVKSEVTDNNDVDLNKITENSNSNGITNVDTPSKVNTDSSVLAPNKDARITPLKSGSANGHIGPDFSASSPTAARRAVSANRPSRPASASKTKRRISSNSPSVDNQVTTVADKPKNVWK